MAVDTPARIAILGAGPVGLEAALYARFLGYDVDVYEQGEVAHHVLQWGHVRMFSPFRMNCSTLGLAALAAQNDEYKPPDGQELLTGRQWAERYLIPLSETDLLVDTISSRTQVVAVGRESVTKPNDAGDPIGAESNFRIQLRNTDGTETTARAHVVLDATGVYGNPNAMGADGIPAQGELAARDRIEYGLPEQVHESQGAEGPIKRPTWRPDHGSADSLDRTSAGVESLRSGEPDFYILGSKSCGCDSSFLFAAGLTQIQQLFTLIGDREDLDLYAHVDNPFR